MAQWRLVLCDINGAAISNVTSIATGKTFSYKLNRPASASFTVPANHPLVANNHSDGYPILDPARRVLKAYRKEQQSDSSYKYVIRFSGYIWQLQDNGDENDATTQVTAYDPMQRLSKRIVRDAAGSKSSPVIFTSLDGGQIAKTIIDRTNNFGGSTGVATTGHFDSVTTQTITYQDKAVGDAIVDFTNLANGFDVAFTPVDQTDGNLVTFNVYEERGSVKPTLIFGWGITPHNVSSISRVLDSESLANDIDALGSTNSGADQLRTNQQDLGSISDYGRYEAVSTYSDIAVDSFLSDLASEELSFRAQPKELVSITPVASDTLRNGKPLPVPEPFTDFDLGDTFYVYAGTRLRGGFAGLQRCYGFDISINDDGAENISNILTQPSN